MDGLHGLRAWRWLFIVEGAITSNYNLSLLYIKLTTNMYSVGIAFAAFFILPNFPRTTSWLTEHERELAVWRLEEDIGEDDWVDSHQQSFMVGLKLAFTDVKTYILMFLLFGIGKITPELYITTYANIVISRFWNCHKLFPVSNNIRSVFQPDSITDNVSHFSTVVKTLNYSNIPTLLLTCPPYVLAVITTFLNSWHAGMFNAYPLGI